MFDSVRAFIGRRSRARKRAQFFALCPPGQSVLDVGVTGCVEFRGYPLNDLLANYDRDPATYTGLGIEDLSALQRAHPEHSFVRYDGKTMPFPDSSFDWAYSNAVIEHVGDDAAQLNYINEMLRVACHVFFTTPNRWFPIETHTNQILRHWNRSAFHLWAMKHSPYHAYPSLNLLGAADLRRLLETSRARYFVVQRNRLCGWPMTFSVIAHQ